MPSVAMTTVPPRPMDSAAPLDGDGTSVEVVSIEPVSVAAQGPGDVQGPALAVTVEIDNGGDKPMSLDGVAVSVSHANEQQASPVLGPPAAPVTGTLAAGDRATGVYVFRVPEQDRSSVAVTVTHGESRRVVPFVDP